MIISHGRKYIFVHIPKTGGTLLALALEGKAMKDEVLIGDTPKAKKRRKRVKDLQTTGIRGYVYLFDEQDTPMPDMGGIEKTLEKRARHRRAVMRLLFERSFTDRLMICADPSNLELLEDFYSDRCATRMLELVCSFDDDYLRGQSIRTGQAGDTSSEDTIKRIVPTIRMDLAHESNAVRDRNYPYFYSISDRHEPEENTMQISAVMDVTEDTAREIAHTPHLFAD